MLTKRTIIEEVTTFQENDIISVTLNGGEEIEALAVRDESDGVIFILVDCLANEQPMNGEWTNKGGYDACDLRKSLNGDILDSFPAEIRDQMIPFTNGDFLRLPTEKEIFGKNPYGEEEPDDVKQFEAMKIRKNRIASQGLNGEPEWYWLQNVIRNSAAGFAYVVAGGIAVYTGASISFGVRPVFKLRKS